MRRGIRQRITAFVIVAALIPLLLVWAVTLWLSYGTAQESARQRQVIVARMAGDSISRFLNETSGQMRVFGETLIRSSTLIEVTPDRVFPILASNRVLAEVGLYSQQGDLIAQAARTPPARLPERFDDPVVRGHMDRGEPFYVDPSPVSETSITPTLRMGVPLFETSQGALIVQGYFVADVSMEYFWDELRLIEESTDSIVLIATQDGRLIGSSQRENIIMHPDLATLPVLMNTEEAQAIEYISPIQNDAVLGTRAGAGPLRWNVIVERPSEVIYRNINTLALSLLGLIVLAAPLTAGIGLFIGKQIAQPVQELEQGVAAFGRDINTYRPVHITTGDELTSLADTFNAMAGKLRESQTAIQESNLELQRALDEVRERSRVQEELTQAIRSLTLPIIPIQKGIVVMPLVGELTTERAQDVGPRLLQTIERDQVRVALLDVTGVPTMTPTVVEAILRTVAASRLMGAETILAGIRPETAEALVKMDSNLEKIRTTATLDQAVALGRDIISRAIRRN